MKKIVKVYHYHMTKYGGFATTSCDMADAEGYVLIGTGEAVIDLLPQSHQLNAELAMLESLEQEIQCQTEKKLADIRERINSIQSTEYARAECVTAQVMESLQ
jgi:hypothetical protein